METPIVWYKRPAFWGMLAVNIIAALLTVKLIPSNTKLESVMLALMMVLNTYGFKSGRNDVAIAHKMPAPVEPDRYNPLDVKEDINIPTSYLSNLNGREN